jgi:hypothetical protein
MRTWGHIFAPRGNNAHDALQQRKWANHEYRMRHEIVSTETVFKSAYSRGHGKVCELIPNEVFTTRMVVERGATATRVGEREPV